MREEAGYTWDTCVWCSVLANHFWRWSVLRLKRSSKGIEEIRENLACR